MKDLGFKLEKLTWWEWLTLPIRASFFYFGFFFLLEACHYSTDNARYYFINPETHLTSQRKDVSELVNKVNAGNPQAMIDLGNAYYFGEKELTRDGCMALQFYDQAARKGSAIGAMKLARAYRDGKGVFQDFEKAFYWATQSINAGNKSSHIFNVKNESRRKIDEAEVEVLSIRPENMSPIELFDMPQLGHFYFIAWVPARSCR